jgi:cytoskeleton protein RodZ
MNPSEYQEIGQYLRESRESLHVTIEDAARALHIRAKYLKALEKGDLNDMPGKAYIRGYIRNYALYLGLEVDKVLEAYGVLIGPKAHDLFIPEPTLQQNLPSRQLIWLSLGGLFLLYGFWYFAIHERSAVGTKVPGLPVNFAHLLDKNAAPAMDKAWEDCLTSDEAGCYIALHAHALYPSNAVLYDIQQDDNSPQEP